MVIPRRDTFRDMPVERHSRFGTWRGGRCSRDPNTRIETMASQVAIPGEFFGVVRAGHRFRLHRHRRRASSPFS